MEHPEQAQCRAPHRGRSPLVGTEVRHLAENNACRQLHHELLVLEDFDGAGSENEHLVSEMMFLHKGLARVAHPRLGILPQGHDQVLVQPLEAAQLQEGLRVLHQVPHAAAVRVGPEGELTTAPPHCLLEDSTIDHQDHGLLVTVNLEGALGCDPKEAEVPDDATWSDIADVDFHTLPLQVLLHAALDDDPHPISFLPFSEDHLARAILHGHGMVHDEGSEDVRGLGEDERPLQEPHQVRVHLLLRHGLPPPSHGRWIEGRHAGHRHDVDDLPAAARALKPIQMLAGERPVGVEALGLRVLHRDLVIVDEHRADARTRTRVREQAGGAHPPAPPARALRPCPAGRADMA
mmetsp:Transcript_44964/g.113961  ORF Transcript_44964/g.113961 Transcript_44964/m.113961 type:complete len:349 (+) Transcript_44964:424-1470(+)